MNELNSSSVKYSAIILAGGAGTRMQSDVPKQYILYDGKPILYYSMKVFEESFVDEIILVCRCGEEEYCRREIVDRYNFTKVTAIVAGGAQRYDSVYAGLGAVNGKYVFIHDGARPCVDNDILEDCKNKLTSVGACVAAVPVKDTIKIVDEKGFAVTTPKRETLWQIQTPQCFEYDLIKKAYDTMYESKQTDGITDDAMVVERFSHEKVCMAAGSYGNIKVTTPDDLIFLQKILKK